MSKITDIERKLRQNVEILLLYGTLIDCPGIVHGKTGIAIFFLHYARYTNNKLFEKYASDLIVEIQEQIHVNSPADYESGLAGIGAGIDYLVCNKFLEAGDHIFDDFDQRIYRATMYDPSQDFSLYEGLTGYGRYWMMRLRHQESSGRAMECLFRITVLIEENLFEIPVNEKSDVFCFLYDLQGMSGFEICAGLLKQFRVPLAESFPRLGNSATGDVIRKYQTNQYFNSDLHYNNITLNQIHDMDLVKPPSELGLLSGYAGEGMLQLTALDHTNFSWMNLL